MRMLRYQLLVLHANVGVPAKAEPAADEDAAPERVPAPQDKTRTGEQVAIAAVQHDVTDVADVTDAGRLMSLM